MRLLSFDPGFDVTGYAMWDWPAPALTPRGLDDALGALLEAGELKTSTVDALAVRLASLGLQVRGLLEAWRPEIVYVEVPAFHGSYTGGKERRRGVNKLYQAIGAILSRTGARTICKPAIREPKTHRHQLLEHAARMAGVELPHGARGARREDAWDAVWLGAQGLLDGDWRGIPHETRTGGAPHDARAEARS